MDEIKPHPALYLQAVEALGVKPEEAVAIEDSKNGALSAMQAGLKCISYRMKLQKHHFSKRGDGCFFFCRNQFKIKKSKLAYEASLLFD